MSLSVCVIECVSVCVSVGSYECVCGFVSVCVYLPILTSEPADQSSRNRYEHFATAGHCEVKFRPIESDQTV